MADGKWIEGLTPDMAVADAAAAVLAARLAVVRHFLPLAAQKPYGNPEYVHQLRVGTRRVGAAVRVFADCLPRKSLKAMKDHLRRLRRAAGDARDWDVFLLSLPEANSLASAASKPARDFLTGYAMGERSAVQPHLADAIETAGPAFMEESATLPGLAREPQDGPTPLSFGELAAAQLGSLLASFTAATAANPTDPAMLHQVRILAKRVRYALEIFADCFPPELKTRMYPAVERVQELLGAVQDAAVGVERLSGLRDRVKRALPDEWPRLQKGIDGQIKALRAKIPAGRKAFVKWRKEWAVLVEAVKLEVVAATVTA